MSRTILIDEIERIREYVASFWGVPLSQVTTQWSDDEVGYSFHVQRDCDRESVFVGWDIDLVSQIRREEKYIKNLLR